MEPLLYQCSDPPGRQSLEPCRQIPPGEWLFPSGVHRRAEAHERIEIGTASLRRISDGRIFRGIICRLHIAAALVIIRFVLLFILY